MRRLGSDGEEDGLGARCAAACGGPRALSGVEWAVDRLTLYSSPPNSTVYVVEKEIVLGDEKPEWAWQPAWFANKGATQMGRRRWARQQAAQADGDEERETTTSENT